MQSFVESLKPYLLIVMTLCVLRLVMRSNHEYQMSNFTNHENPWSAAMMTQFMTEPSAANHRQGFESAPLSMRLSSSLHGEDNFVGSMVSKISNSLSNRGGFVGSMASKISNSLAGRSAFEGPNVTAPVKASGAAAQLAALLKK
jgi:hypothetical protein